MKIQSGGSRAYRFASVVILVILAILFTFPLYWIITGAFKPGADINSVKPVWWPSQWVPDNFNNLLNKRSANLWQLAIPFSNWFSDNGQLLYWSVGPEAPAAFRWLINAVFMAVAAMVITCLTAAMAGYALAKKRFNGRAILFSLIVCAMALPKQVILIPLLREMSTLKLYGSLWAVIFPTVGWPFGVFLMKQFSEGIPGEILEASRIDGSSEWNTFYTVVMPMIKRPGHLHLHQLLERLLHAAGYAGLQQRVHHPPGHRNPPGGDFHRHRPAHGRRGPGLHPHHCSVPGLPEVLYPRHCHGRGQGIKICNEVQINERFLQIPGNHPRLLRLL